MKTYIYFVGYSFLIQNIWYRFGKKHAFRNSCWSGKFRRENSRAGYKLAKYENVNKMHAMRWANWLQGKCARACAMDVAACDEIMANSQWKCLLKMKHFHWSNHYWKFVCKLWRNNAWLSFLEWGIFICHCLDQSLLRHYAPLYSHWTKTAHLPFWRIRHNASQWCHTFL